jgi:hypothetical protein
MKMVVTEVGGEVARQHDVAYACYDMLCDMLCNAMLSGLAHPHFGTHEVSLTASLSFGTLFNSMKRHVNKVWSLCSGTQCPRGN